ncbi:MAG: hypothetical protein FJY66_03715, partial [Calditrichaeota bacterium]|nr:hypothetical protein [Calditrichota bacterium]
MKRFLFIDILRQFVPFFSHLARELQEQGEEVFFAGLEDIRAHILLRKLRQPILFGRNLRLKYPSPLSDAELEESIHEHWEVNHTGVEDAYFRSYLLKHARRISGLLNHFLERTKPDAIVVYNGLTGAGSLAFELARRRGLKTWFFENGFFPWTLQCDPQGVNFKNSLQPLSGEAFEAVEVNPNRLHAFVEYLRAAHVPDFAYRTEAAQDLPKGLKLSLWRLWRGQYLEWLPDWRRHLRLRRALYAPLVRYSKSLPEAPIAEPYLFVPLQVNQDTQIRTYSPNVPNMEALVELVCEAWHALNRPELRLVVKEHPAESPRISYTAVRKRHPEIHWVEAGPTQEWLAAAKVVITVNSSAGVEALAFGRPVITLGKAFYNKEGIVFHCERADELSEKITEALQTPLDVSRIEKFVYFLRFQ